MTLSKIIFYNTSIKQCSMSLTPNPSITKRFHPNNTQSHPFTDRVIYQQTPIIIAFDIDSQTKHSKSYSHPRPVVLSVFSTALTRNTNPSGNCEFRSCSPRTQERARFNGVFSNSVRRTLFENTPPLPGSFCMRCSG